MMLATGETSTTRMLAVLPYTTVTSRNVAAAEDLQLAPMLSKSIVT
jgi:hypothetical protein